MNVTTTDKDKNKCVRDQLRGLWRQRQPLQFETSVYKVIVQ